MKILSIYFQCCVTCRRRWQSRESEKTCPHYKEQYKK